MRGSVKASERQRDSVVAFMESQALALHRVFEDNKVMGSLMESWQAPRWLVYRVRLHNFDKRTVDRAEALAGPIRSALGTDSVNVYTHLGVVHIEVPSPWPVSIGGSKLRGAGLRVPLGTTGRYTIDKSYDTIDMDFANPSTPHLLVVGATGSGKSTAIKAIMYHLIRQNGRNVRFAIAAPENKVAADWRTLADFMQVSAVIFEPDELMAFANWAAAQVVTRPAQRLPHWFLIFDDLPALLRKTKIKGALAEIAAQGRTPGIHLIIGTQRVGEDGAGGAAVTDNLTTRLVMATATAQSAAQLAGRGRTGADALTDSGDAMLIHGSEKTRVPIAAVSEADMADLLYANGGIRRSLIHPWTDQPRQEVEPPSTSVLNTLQMLRPGDPLPKGPLLRMTQPDTEAYEVLRLAYHLTGGKTNQTLYWIYGDKNPRLAKWLKEATGERA